MAAVFQIIEAGGSPREMGRAIGNAVAGAMRGAVLKHPEFAESRGTWGGGEYVAWLERAARDAYPWVVEEIEGLAEGVGLPFQDVFIWNCRGDLRLPPDAAKERIAAAAEGCTTIMAPPECGRHAVIAHNEDGAAAFAEHRFWLRARPANAPAFESYLYPGMIAGHSFAVTATGLVQTINNIRPDDLKPGVPRHVICRAVLAAATLDEAIGHLRRTDRASGFHHALARAGENRVLSVEAPASACVVRELKAPAAHANHLIDPSLADRAQVITGSSDYRQRAADAYLAAGGDPDRPEEILFRRGDGNECVLRRPDDGGDDYGYTLATGIFRIGPDGVDWTVHTGPDGRDALSGRTGG